MNHEQFKKMNEKDIIRTSIRQFYQNTGINPSMVEEERAVMEFTTGGRKRSFRLLVKNEIRQGSILDILAETGKDRPHWLLIAQYIPHPIKKDLREQGINYLESAGNGYIHSGDFYYLMDGKPVTPVRKTATGKLWKRAGLQFVFALLTNKDFLDGTYRQMSEVAGIALGNIGQLLEELVESGFLEKEGDEYRIRHKDQLYQRWADLYPVVLKPTLILGKFTLREDFRQRWRDLAPQQTQWGGEPGAALYTGFLKPERFTLYTKAPLVETVKSMKLIPNPEGEVEIVQKFWKGEEASLPAVPPLIIYAELMASSDSRNREAAVRIKNEFLHD
jgi:hypothetical protein